MTNTPLPRNETHAQFATWMLVSYVEGQHQGIAVCSAIAALLLTGKR